MEAKISEKNGPRNRQTIRPQWKLSEAVAKIMLLLIKGLFTQMIDFFTVRHDTRCCPTKESLTQGMLCRTTKNRNISNFSPQCNVNWWSFSWSRRNCGFYRIIRTIRSRVGGSFLNGRQRKKNIFRILIDIKTPIQKGNQSFSFELTSGANPTTSEFTTTMPAWTY
jgi:hypothetical protein